VLRREGEYRFFLVGSGRNNLMKPENDQCDAMLKAWAERWLEKC